MIDKKVWQSFVWHRDKCFFVSTIERTFDCFAFSEKRGFETIVWEYDYETGKRGKQIGQMGDIVDHINICRCLILTGEMLDEDNPKHARFFKNGEVTE